MQLQTELYQLQRARWPAQGRHILAQYDEASVVVYQAYRPAIGHFAARHGFFGGEFSLTRMSWFKPNFLWMMYRSGWGTKADQEVTLAVRLRREFFERVLAEAVPSTFDEELYSSFTAWQKAVAASDARLQWDPDHAPSGARQARRALQIGLRNSLLHEYARDAILAIEDISDFVAAQRPHAADDATDLLTPAERVYLPANPEVAGCLKLSL